MFGSSDNNSQDNQAPAGDPQVVLPDQPPASDQPATSDDQSFLPSVPSVSATTPPADDQALPTPDIDATALDALAGNHEPAAEATSSDDSSAPAAPSASADVAADEGHDDLLKLKQSALQQLSPLVGHLEQTSEEKFKTLMMMIQASDDKSLVNDAYEAAQAIEDDKVRAQALLDIVNEINYFTQQKNED